MGEIARAVSTSIAAGDVDGEWKQSGALSPRRQYAEMLSECYALCSGRDARNDYYAMVYATLPQTAIRRPCSSAANSCCSSGV